MKVRVDEMSALLPVRAWQKYSAGVGAKGPVRFPRFFGGF
jgi:hypothetical protein